jgi:hypothetical protein
MNLLTTPLGQPRLKAWQQQEAVMEYGSRWHRLRKAIEDDNVLLVRSMEGVKVHAHHPGSVPVADTDAITCVFS